MATIRYLILYGDYNMIKHHCFITHNNFDLFLMVMKQI